MPAEKVWKTKSVQPHVYVQVSGIFDIKAHKSKMRVSWENTWRAWLAQVETIRPRTFCAISLSINEKESKADVIPASGTRKTQVKSVTAEIVCEHIIRMLTECMSVCVSVCVFHTHPLHLLMHKDTWIMHMCIKLQYCCTLHVATIWFVVRTSFGRTAWPSFATGPPAVCSRKLVSTSCKHHKSVNTPCIKQYLKQCINQSINQSINQCINQSTVKQCINQSMVRHKTVMSFYCPWRKCASFVLLSCSLELWMHTAWPLLLHSHDRCPHPSPLLCRLLSAPPKNAQALDPPEPVGQRIQRIISNFWAGARALTSAWTQQRNKPGHMLRVAS